jgi:hypothetical protein
MASAGLLLALLVGQTPAPAKELVALPLTEEAPIKAPVGLDALKVVTAELKKQSERLGVSTALQKKRHEWVIGPARERARDCGQNAECLAEIGAALGADVLVAGTVDASGVALIAVQVKTGKKLAAARSPKKLASSSIQRRALTATRALIEAMAKTPAAVAVAPKPEDPARLPPPVEEPPPAVAAASPVATGELRIEKDQLTGVSEVTVDGEALLFTGDGTMSWRGAPGAHSLVAVRSDGNRVTKEVVIDAGQTTAVTLEFVTAAVPPPTAAASAATEVEAKDDEIWTAWWFWTSLGAAVAAGATTAALLAGGAKGGPDIEGETGTVRGTY